MPRSCRSFLLVVLIVIFASMPAIAQEKPSAETFKGIDAFIDGVLTNLKVSGMAVAVVKGDEVVFSKGFGYADIENKRAVTPRTLFAIGSSSKAFTAAILAMLVDEGKIDWDKPVRTWLPDFRMFDDYASENLTPRDLLSHTSGLPRHDLLWYGTPFSREEIYRKLQYLEPNKTFRANWEYQNLMFLTAGWLAEKITGKTWEELVKERIFTPLGMDRSNLSVTALAAADDRAIGYGLEKDKSFKKLEYRNIDAIGPAGSINSSVEDMANWLKLQINRGKFGDKQLIAENSVKTMHTITTAMRQYPEDDMRGVMGYGMAWFIQWYRGHYVVEHGGNIDGFSALVSVMPHQKIGVVLLTNTNGANAANAVVVRNIYDRLLGLDQYDWLGKVNEQLKKAEENQTKEEEKTKAGKVEGTKPSLPLDVYAGEFEHVAYGLLTIAVDGDHLKLSRYGHTMKLEHFHFDQFVTADDLFDGVRVHFVISDRGTIDSLTIPLEQSLDPIVFTRKAPDALKSAEYLAQFVGEYELMGQVGKYSLRGDDLILELPNQPVWTMTPTAKDEFAIKELKGFTVKFVRDAEGKVIEAIYQQPNGSFTAKKK